jgi:hypothetical protein
VTPEQLQAIEDKRREREDELLLILLLLLGWASWKSDLLDAESVALTFGYTAANPNNAKPLANRETLAEFRRVFTAQAVNEVSASMAEMFRDAFPLYRPGRLFADDPAQLLREFTPTARESVDAMVDAIARGIVGAGGDVRAGMTIAGYTRESTNGLELGAERNIVTASNAGLLAAAIDDGDAGRVTGLEHVSVLDDGTTEICRPRDGLMLPVSDPYWRRSWPSLHWRCRSIIRPLTGSFQVSTALPTVPPMAGFGIAPPIVLAMLERASRSGNSRGAAA